MRIPQALRSKDITAYNKILKECFGAQRVKDASNPMLDVIFKLKPKHVITTNFDTVIETYLRDKEPEFYFLLMYFSLYISCCVTAFMPLEEYALVFPLSLSYQNRIPPGAT